MAIQQRYTNWKQVRNLQYHIYACYFVHVFTEIYSARWYKDVKHASSSAKRVSRYLRWDSRASKRISFVRTQYKEDNIFIWCCVWRKFSSALAYTSRPYSEAMAMRLEVTYTPYATSSKEQARDVITFAQFEEGNIWTETQSLVSHLRVLFCPCIVCKAMANVQTKTLNIRHQEQKGFRGIFDALESQRRYCEILFALDDTCLTSLYQRAL